METQEPTLKEVLLKLNSNVEKFVEQKEAKKFKLPFFARLNKKEAANGYVTVCIVRENRNVDFAKAKINEGVISIDGCPRISTTDHLLSYQGQPFLILPEWSVRPFSPTENYDKTIQEQMASAGFKLLLNAVMRGKVEDSKKFQLSGKMIFGIVVGLIVVGYLLLKGGG